MILVELTDKLTMAAVIRCIFLRIVVTANDVHIKQGTLYDAERLTLRILEPYRTPPGFSSCYVLVTKSVDAPPVYGTQCKRLMILAPLTTLVVATHVLIQPTAKRLK